MQLRQTMPPYSVFVAISDRPRPSRGQLIVAEMEARELGLVDRLEHLREIRIGIPWAGFVLHVVGTGDGHSGALATLAARLTQVCACTSGHLHPRAVFLSLTDPVDPTALFRAFICQQRPALTPHVLSMLEEVIDGEGTQAFTEADCRQFQRAGLPRPDPIARVRRALPVLLELQRNRAKPVLSAALEAGFSDGSSFSDSCLRLFGERPRALRRLAGPRWALWCWWMLHESSRGKLPRSTPPAGRSRIDRSSPDA